MVSECLFLGKTPISTKYEIHIPNIISRNDEVTQIAEDKTRIRLR